MSVDQQAARKMNMNGIMRLRIVVALTMFVCGLAWVGLRYTEMSVLRDQAALTLSALEPCSDAQWSTKYGQYACAETQAMIDDAQIALETNTVSAAGAIQLGAIVSVLPAVLFWLLGSIIGWVYRGFKQSKAN